MDSGLTEAEVDRVTVGSEAPGWSRDETGDRHHPEPTWEAVSLYRQLEAVPSDRLPRTRHTVSVDHHSTRLGLSPIGPDVLQRCRRLGKSP
jgi:hypothetical protein